MTTFAEELHSVRRIVAKRKILGQLDEATLYAAAVERWLQKILF